MNTHEKYCTKAHHHMDWSYVQAGQFEYPSSALMLVQAGDGQWFLEQEFGDAFSDFEGVVKSASDLATVPTFHADVDAAAAAAFAMMKQVYPDYHDDQLADFLADDE